MNRFSRLSAPPWPIMVCLLILGALCGCAIHPGRAPEIVRAWASRPEAITIADGTLIGASAPAGRAFLGIPYAAPPVGPLRWKPPQPVKPWPRPRDATRPSAACVQTVGLKGSTGQGGGFVIGNENCLTLNIYTPPATAPRPASGWPVMTFLPGGAFVLGAGDNYDPSLLASSQGVIVVTVNYRLGAFGFLADPALKAESPRGGSGNFGLLDQQAGLRWVRDNIAAFGGDARNVTLFGESAGSWSTCYQMVSPGAAGLFQRAILQSGSCTDNRSLVTEADAERGGPALARALGCTDPASALDCLRAQPASTIARARGTRWGIDGPRSFGPVWGDAVVPVDPSTAFRSGRADLVPVIVGTNRDEGRLFALRVRDEASYERQLHHEYGARAPLVLERYPSSAYRSPREAYAAQLTDSRFACPTDELRNLLAAGTTVYGYEFADENAPFRLPRLFTGPMGAYHASELAYVFGKPWALASPAGFTSDQAALSARIMNAWGRFARGELPAADWPAYTAREEDILTLQPEGDERTSDFAERHSCGFWREFHRGDSREDRAQ